MLWPLYTTRSDYSWTRISHDISNSYGAWRASNYIQRHYRPVTVSHRIGASFSTNWKTGRKVIWSPSGDGVKEEGESDNETSSLWSPRRRSVANRNRRREERKRARKDAVASLGELRISVFGMRESDVSTKQCATVREDSAERENDIRSKRLSASSVSPSSSAPAVLRMLFRDYRDSLSRLCDVYRNVTARHAVLGSSPARSGIKSSENKRLEQKASLTRSHNGKKKNLNKHKRWKTSLETF